MNEFKNFLTCLLGAIALILTIAASVGAINYGIEHSYFYTIAGFCNLVGWVGLIAYSFYKQFINNE